MLETDKKKGKNGPGARLASIRAIPLSFSARGPKINNIEKKV